MQNVTFSIVEVQIDGPVLLEDINIGSITLSREGREYILDTTSSEFIYSEGGATVNCKIEEDREVFSECKYDLTADDLLADDLVATFYFTWETRCMLLFAELHGETTIAIELTHE